MNVNLDIDENGRTHRERLLGQTSAGRAHLVLERNRVNWRDTPNPPAEPSRQVKRRQALLAKKRVLALRRKPK